MVSCCFVCHLFTIEGKIFKRTLRQWSKCSLFPVKRFSSIICQEMKSSSALQQRAVAADQVIADLKSQLQSIRLSAVAEICVEKQRQLAVENEELRVEVERLKKELIALEGSNGVKQIPVPSAKSLQSAAVSAMPTAVANGSSGSAPTTSDKKTTAKPVAQNNATEPKKTAKTEPKPAKSKPETVGDAAAAAAGEKIDVSRLNMRIGRILDVKKHPDADSLYVEQVDVGEANPRTVVSGLVKHIPIEQMQNRIAVFLLNLKPAKMRGVSSEAMIMCGSTPEKVEIIEPPAGVAIGDRVSVEGYPGNPDDQLNPKKKIWEQVQPDLQINADGIATYKGARWFVEGKEGVFKVPTLVNSPIK